MNSICSFDYTPIELEHASKDLIEPSLTIWLKEWNNSTEKHIAARKIRAAFTESAWKLDLSDLRLDCLPGCWMQFKQLRVLFLNNNNLTSLPKEIGEFSQLQKLYLGNNNLAYLPSEIGNLSQLQRLYLYNNKLTCLPKEIGNLSQLRKLSLSKNQLTCLPKEIGNLSQLQVLDLKYNSNLNELPLKLRELTYLVNLGTDDRAPLASMRETILGDCRAKRDKLSPTTFPILVDFWLKIAGRQAEAIIAKGLASLPEREKSTLNEWLLRLQGTEDFNHSQEGLSYIVCNLLETLIIDAEFKAKFMPDVEDNNAHNKDQSLERLSLLLLSWKIGSYFSRFFSDVGTLFV